MNKLELFETWTNALSKFQQESFNGAFLNDIDAFEISSGAINIKVGKNLYECSMEDLAKETGRTLKYLEVQFSSTPDEDIRETLELSFFSQNNIERFFIELRDAVISQANIFLIDRQAIDFVDELQAQYTNIWNLAPNVQQVPFPKEEDMFPDLDNYELSFIAVGE